jgi:hypothetical protein
LSSTRGRGATLPVATQSFMNQAFGTDFSSVRVHTDGAAASLSQQLNARAFTYGSDIYFNRGEFAPESSEGKRLLGHELTHVLQQTKLGSSSDKLGNLKSNTVQRSTLTTINPWFRLKATAYGGSVYKFGNNSNSILLQVEIPHGKRQKLSFEIVAEWKDKHPYGWKMGWGETFWSEWDIDTKSTLQHL